MQRSFCPEKLVAVATTADGAYIAGGGVSGALYLGEAGSGRLLRTWAGHYKVCTEGREGLSPAHLGLALKGTGCGADGKRGGAVSLPRQLHTHGQPGRSPLTCVGGKGCGLVEGLL